MGEVIEFSAAWMAKSKGLRTAKTRCLNKSCGHTWFASTPISIETIRCPSCKCPVLVGNCSKEIEK